MKRNGFTLLETLIVLGLSLLVLLGAFEFYGITQRLFIKVKDAQEISQAMQAALVRLRADLLRAGFGLEAPLREGVVEGIEISDGSLTIRILDEEFALAADAFSGDRRISLEKVSGLGPGRRVCPATEERAEVHTIAALDGTTIVLAEPLKDSYPASAGRLLLLEEVTYFLDARSGILRRKVNASPAQPLLDEAVLFVPVYQREDNLVRLSLGVNGHRERTYELTIFPKNLGLAHP